MDICIYMYTCTYKYIYIYIYRYIYIYTIYITTCVEEREVLVEVGALVRERERLKKREDMTISASEYE